MAKINDLPLLSNPTEDMYCLVGKEDVQKVPWSAIMGQIGAPYIATTVAGMTDKTRVYVYQGSESGYTSGNWYYWNGSAWTSGGTYNSAAVDTDKTLTQSDKPADSAVVGKEIGSLKESKITKFYASNQGETHLADSDNGKIMDMMLYGKSEQFTATGKNLLKIRDVTQTIRGVTVTAKDGVVALKGTATETGWTFIDVDSFVLDGTYILSSNITDIAVVLANKSFKAVLNQNNSKTLENEEASKVCFTVTKGKTYDISNILVQIEKGSKATSYEPYVGGKPSPSPDYPQEIKSVVNPIVKLSNEGGTQFETVILPYTLNAVPVESDGNVTINGQQYVADYVDVERGKLVRMVDSSKLDNTQSIIGKIEWLLAEPQEINLTTEQTQAFKALATYYPTTNISVNSEQLDGYTVFNYPISMANGWNYVKQQLNDNRDYIYDMDLQSAEAYVNSEYAVALTELEV